MIDRRSFLAAAVAAPLVGACSATRRGGAPLPSRPGVQLYTVRDAMANDSPGTLAALAEIGYREVELAGTYGMTPSEFRGRLDDAGLRAVSGHVQYEEVRRDWARTLDAAAELGHELVVLPWLPETVRSADGYRAAAEDFNRAGEAARQMGMRFGYHNHHFEFEPIEGEMPMALLLDGADPELVDWQMDIYWIVDGGADPMEWLGFYPGRVTSVHLKDRTTSGEMVDVGDGVIDFAAIVSTASTQGLRYGFVEHDTPGDSIASVRRSFEYWRGVAA